MVTRIRATSPKDPIVLPAIIGIWLLVSVKGEMKSHIQDIIEEMTKNAFIRGGAWIDIRGVIKEFVD